MEKHLFVKMYYNDALASEKATGIPADVQLAQAAIESSWGDAAPRFAFFGIKATGVITANDQLENTTEYSKIYTSDPLKVGLAKITSVEPFVSANGVKMFKYHGQAWFRAYNNAADSFTDHANFFLKNPRYAIAITDKKDSLKFADDIAAAGYGSGPTYATLLKEIILEVRPIIAQLQAA